MVLTIDEYAGVTYYANQHSEFYSNPAMCFDRGSALKGRYVQEGKGSYQHTPEIRVLYYDKKGRLRYTPYYVSSESR